MTDTTHQPTFKTVTKIPLGNRLLRRKDVEQKTGKSRSAIYDGIRQGTFPARCPSAVRAWRGLKRRWIAGLPTAWRSASAIAWKTALHRYA